MSVIQLPTCARRGPLVRRRRVSSPTARLPRRIDKDDSGSLDREEIVKSVRADKKVIDFLTNCGNKNLQYLLVPARLDSALAQMDTDRDGEFSLSEWEDAIETALSNKLAQRAAAREAQRKAAAKEIAEFTGEFLNAARHCFEMIDKDGGGTLSTAEIVKAVKEDQVSNAASYDRAPFNLRGLRGLCDRPSRHHLLSTHRKSLHSSGPAARKICSSSSTRRASRRRWRCLMRTARGKLTLRNGASCGVLYNSMSLVTWGDSETRVDGV